MTNEHSLELLLTSYDAVTRAGDFETCAEPRDWVRKSNRLLDACFDAGMSNDEPDHHEWAATALTKWMVS